MRVAVVVIVKRLRRAASLLIGNSFETTFHIQCRLLRRRRLPKVRLQRHHNERRQPHNDRRDSAQQSGGSPSFRIRKVFAALQRDGWQGRGIWVPNTGVSLQVTIAVFPAFSLGL